MLLCEATLISVTVWLHTCADSMCLPCIQTQAANSVMSKNWRRSSASCLKCSDKFRLEFNFHVILDIFYMPQICDMRQTALLRAEDFFALKNPTASAGFVPANLGTKGQHATSRPPKPMYIYIYIYIYIWNELILSVVTIISGRESSLVLNVAAFSSYLCKIQ